MLFAESYWSGITIRFFIKFLKWNHVAFWVFSTSPVVFEQWFHSFTLLLKRFQVILIYCTPRNELFILWIRYWISQILKCKRRSDKSQLKISKTGLLHSSSIPRFNTLNARKCWRVCLKQDDSFSVTMFRIKFLSRVKHLILLQIL